MARTAPQVVVTVTAEALATKFKGLYASGAQYHPGEWVEAKEQLWACNEAVKGVEPAVGSSAWSLIGSIA